MYTQKMIASKLGISVGTVSLALRDSPLLKLQTRQRVQEFAERVHYRPSNLGRALQSGKSHMIGCLLYSVLGSFHDELLEGMAQTATDHEYALLTSMPSPVQHQLVYLNRMLVHHIDGLILATRIEDASVLSTLEQLHQSGMPVIFCSTHEHGNLPFVVTDDHRGGVLAIQHLAETGHRHIILLNDRTVPPRLDGALTAIRQSGLHCTLASNCDDIPAILQDTHADGIVLFSDQVAIQVIRLLRDAGIRVPEDVSIIGYDDLPLASFPEFNLTTIAQQRLELGIRATQFILQSVSSQQPDPQVYLAPSLVRRGTVHNRF